MQNSYLARTRKGLFLTLFVLGLVTALILLPSQLSFETGAKGAGLFTRTVSGDDGLAKMWDIREDKESLDVLEGYRQSLGTDAVAVANIRQKFVTGEAELISRVPHAKVEYNLDIRIPEVITPDTNRGNIEFLTPPSNTKRSEILRNFIKENENLIGVTPRQADGLKVVADYTNPDGNLSFAHLEQLINDVPVFRGEVKAGFTRDGRMIRVINNLAPGLDYSSLSTDFRDPKDAVIKAGAYLKHEFRNGELVRNDGDSTVNKVVFGKGDWSPTAERMYFPTEPGVAVPAWRVLIWERVNAYYVIVSADGTVLWHKNIVDDQTQSATYNVYTNPNAYLNSADSPAPLTPGPLDPATGTQGSLLTRNDVTLIGNEGTNSFNNNGWITDGANITDGNSNEAGIDRDGINGVDAPQTGNPNRVFTTSGPAWNPPPGNPAPGDAPLDPQAQRGAVIQMFYIMNLYHDELYKRGFTEQARNFQASNFGRGGVENDRVSSEGQDSSGTNNANFATPADGGRGRMQMFLWTGPTPDKDGTTDADVVIHEVSHGTSNRLVGNGSGLGNQGGMMGEGWSDWFGHTMLAEPTDPINGVYTTGGYATHLIGGTFTANYFYGIRRFPKAVIAFTGGPNRPGCNNGPCPYNPLTFGHINVGCDTTLGTPANAVTSAFPRSPAIATSGNCSQVHNAGEIWSSALWEVRSLMVSRLGFAAGTTRVLQVVVDGMKLSPLNPTMLQMRDAIITGAAALPAIPEAQADVADVREGFRRRGMGFSASVQSASAVTEAFDGWTLSAGNGTVTSGNNLLEPNECNTIDVPLTNNGNAAATGVTAVLSSTTPGITVNQPNSAYPDMPAGAGPVTNTTPFQVSVDNTVACFTTASFTLTVSFSGSGGGSPVVKNFSLPVGIPGNAYTFQTTTGGTIPAGGTLVAGSTADDAAVTIPLPAGWTSTVYDVAVTSLSASTNGMVTVNGAASTAFTNTALLAAVGGTNPTLFPAWDDYDMDPGDTTNGGIFVNTVGSAPNRQFYIEWRATHFSETATTISHNFAVQLNEGTSTVRYIYVLTGITPNVDGASATVGVQRSSAAGSVFTQVGFNTAGTTAPGRVLTGTLPPGQCTPGSGTCGAVAVRSRADFDGDGKTDLSVFRGSEGNWYMNQSTAGFQVLNWGVSSDVLVPGDYDNDGKTDTAVFRPTADPSQPDFYILNSNGFTLTGASWGLAGDTAVVADYDGDGKTNVAVYRPSNNTFYILNGNGSATIRPYGVAGDIPVAGDFLGNSNADITVYRPSTNTFWIFNGSGDTVIPFGAAGDFLVPADYNGDNKDDLAVFRPSTGQWIYRSSSGGATVFGSWGAAGDVPVPGDYDGDGTDDFAIYRNGQWWVNRSTSGIFVQNFGLGTDVAIPRRYLP